MLRVIFNLSDAEFNDSSDIDIFDILEKIKSLYEYNAILRENLLATESEIRALATKASCETEHQT